MTTSSDHTAIFWDAKSGALLRVLQHNDVVNSGAFSPDGKTVVTAGNERIARVWDVATGVLLETLVGHDGNVNQAAYSPDAKHIRTISGDGTIRIWDAAAVVSRDRASWAHIGSGETSPIRMTESSS